METEDALALIQILSQTRDLGHLAQHRDDLFRMFSLALAQCAKAERQAPCKLGALKQVELRVIATFENNLQIGSGPIYDPTDPNFETQARAIE